MRSIPTGAMDSSRNRAAPTAARPSRAASSPAASRMPRCTPPTSDLWVTAASSSLTATGPGSSARARWAAARSAQARRGGVAMPRSPRMVLASSSSRSRRGTATRTGGRPVSLRLRLRLRPRAWASSRRAATATVSAVGPPRAGTPSLRSASRCGVTCSGGPPRPTTIGPAPSTAAASTAAGRSSASGSARA